MWTILLLLASNVFMTFAWYGHLKHRSAAIWLAVLASWGIAFFEYCLQVPANRMGAGYGFTVGQLKVIQEVVTLTVFVVFCMFYFPENKLTWNYYVGFALIAAGAGFVFVNFKVPA